uniref:TSA: Wollemia nobilis Ref_Wollemi_Transcript_18745_2346 transcribed RNA sequence n=1 Tax=Wollemia nobilis TaxID=56998 RepID=A0A0C9S2P7_9CONI
MAITPETNALPSNAPGDFPDERTVAEPEKFENSLTLTALLSKAAEDFPDQKAVIVSGKYELLHSELRRIVDACAAQLRKAGIGHGDVVALSFPNSIEFVVLFMAVIRARGVAAPLNAAYTADEFEFYLQDSESKLLLVPSEGNAAAESAAVNLKIPTAGARFGMPSNGSKVVEFLPKSAGLDLRSSAEAEPDACSDVQNVVDDVALFLHTSGTTSRPKGVPLTQLNLAASTQHIRDTYELSSLDTTVVILPLFHVHGLMAALLSSLVAGATVALPAAGRFSASAFWSDMRSHGATWYTAVPTIHQILLDRHAAKPEDAYPKLRFIRSCSASLAPVILEHLETVFGAAVLEAYAMTEASHQMTSNPLPHRGPRKAGSVGKPMGLEMAILDQTGVPQPPGSSGEVCIRGPNVTGGYRNNPEANKTAFQFGWFHTGDLGYLDEEGYLFLIGRIKELINRGGEKISPMEVDAVLLSHPAVGQAVAFAVPDEKYGEEINAAVVPHEGATVTGDEIISHCKKNLAAFKIPKRVFVTDSLPKTASGKIQRRVMADHFGAGARGKVGA